MAACGAKRTFGAMDEVREVPNPEVGKLQFHSTFGSQNGGIPIQSGSPSFRRFSAIRFRGMVEKTIACLNFATVRSG